MELPAGGAIFAAGFVIAVICAATVPYLRYRRWRYEIRERDLFLSHGSWFYVLTLIPFDRIQYVETHQGPLDLAFRLMQLVVYTAAGKSGPDPGPRPRRGGGPPRGAVEGGRHRECLTPSPRGPTGTQAPLPPPASMAWRRLHPAAIAVWTSSVIGGLALPILFFVLIGDRSGSIGFVMLAAGIALAAAIVRWSRFWYRLDDRALHLRGGLLQRWERTIQLPRIQSVDVVQKLTHRAFGVVELRIEVVGGQSTEAPLVALLPDEATRLRALLASDLAEEGEPSEPPLVRMRPATCSSPA